MDPLGILVPAPIILAVPEGWVIGLHMTWLVSNLLFVSNWSRRKIIPEIPSPLRNSADLALLVGISLFDLESGAFCFRVRSLVVANDLTLEDDCSKVKDMLA